ncbi:YbdK family carboxylate-amine ligase [Paludibacterium paludis]|nr:YbdK family carboxylate-amine ligase [Paludibacterium paludis]
MLDFTPSRPLTLGVELELMILNRRDYNLTRGSDDLLSLLDRKQHGFDIKPEITQGMIEIATAVHETPDTLLDELQAIRQCLVTAAEKLNLGLAGGGSHPFQHWDDQRIYPKERYRLVSELYGYLAKQFTVYGQHIHVGCPNGDWAVRLTRHLARFMPHFVALSASSPFYQGVDTAFQSSRLTSINAFPLSGTMPPVENWGAFNDYFGQMQSLGIVASIKDFYWDIRPKPEYGTVEIRICDTPLTIDTAAMLAAYAQMLAHHFFASDAPFPDERLALTYNYNRFQACRFGYDGVVVIPDGAGQTLLLEDLLATLGQVQESADTLGLAHWHKRLRDRALKRRTDSHDLRDIYRETGSLSEVVRRQSQLWMYASDTPGATMLS